MTIYLSNTDYTRSKCLLSEIRRKRHVSGRTPSISVIKPDIACAIRVTVWKLYLLLHLYVTHAVTTSTSLMEAMKHLERMTARVRSRNSIGSLVFLLADFTLLNAVWTVWNKILLPTVVSYLSVRLSNYCPYIVHLRTFGLFKNITSWYVVSVFRRLRAVYVETEVWFSETVVVAVRELI